MNKHSFKYLVDFGSLGGSTEIIYAVSFLGTHSKQENLLKTWSNMYIFTIKKPIKTMNDKVRDLLEPLQVIDYAQVEIRDTSKDVSIYLAYDNKSDRIILVDPIKLKTIEVPKDTFPEFYVEEYLRGKIE